MKPFSLLLTILTIILTLLGNGCQKAADKPDVADSIQYKELAKGVFFQPGGDGGENHAVIVGEGTLLIVNAPGDEKLSAQMAEYWHRIKPNLRPILILTSSYPRDWLGFRAWKKAYPTLEVWMHKATFPIAVKDGITGGKTIETVEIADLGGTKAELTPIGPAATAGDLVIYLPELNILFSGELILDFELPKMLASDTPQWINRLQELATRSLDKIVPTHGKVLDIEALNWTRQYLVLLRSQICLLKGQGYADEDVYYFLRIPTYEKYIEGEELYRQNVYYVLKEIKEKGDTCTLPSKEMPKYGPVTIEEVQKQDL